MTRFVQPLDVCINKPFKNAMRKAYTEYEIKKGIQNKPTHEDLISILEKVWYDPNLLTSEMIKKSFKICGISNSLMVARIIFLNGLKKLIQVLLLK